MDLMRIDSVTKDMIILYVSILSLSIYTYVCNFKPAIMVYLNYTAIHTNLYM